MIYHITTRAAWQAAETLGAYHAHADERAGFIHAATAQQIVTVANTFYKDQTDLVLVCIDESQLEAEVRWEAPMHPTADGPPEVDEDERFPHIYGPVNLDAVVRVVDLPIGPNGNHRLPQGID